MVNRCMVSIAIRKIRVRGFTGRHRSLRQARSSDMDPKLHELADRRLEEELETSGAVDPRPGCRELLVALRGRDQDLYDDAVREYHGAVVRAIAEEGAPPLECWLSFGVHLARLAHPGRTVVIDSTGRAGEYRPPPSWSDLILHLPEQTSVRALAVGVPSGPSPAQQATHDLLVLARLRLPEA